MTPRPSRPDLRQRRAAEIVQAAAEVFAEKGYRRARMIDVARRAGIGKGTVYEYFRDKRELFLAVFDWYVEGILASGLAAAEPSVDPPGALRRLVAGMLTATAEVLYLYPLTLEFWAAAAGSEFGERMNQEFRDLYRRYGEAVAAILREGMAAGHFARQIDPEGTARVLVGALDGLFLQAWLDPGFDAPAAGRAFLDVVLGGLASPAPAPPETE
jgi:TetR/AcrR family transcriptional regulator, repressor for uid operon